MGHGRRTPCDSPAADPGTSPATGPATSLSAADATPVPGADADGGAGAEQSSGAAALLVEKVLRPYIDAGLAAEPSPHELSDPAGMHLPLVRQRAGKTVVLEQPVDFTTLGGKYADFAEVRRRRGRSCVSLIWYHALTLTCKRRAAGLPAAPKGRSGAAARQHCPASTLLPPPPRTLS